MTKIKIVSLHNAELLSGILLTISFIVAILIANIPITEDIYKKFVFYPVIFGVGDLIYKVPLIQIVNDGLMTLFFLLIGLELKYHMVLGEFQDRKTLILPKAAAIGGIALPSLIYYIFNINSPDTIDGWAIPIATDTAFVLGILAFFGCFISTQLRAFIIGFSLIDDAIALLILAVFYSKGANIAAISASLILIAILFLFNRLNITKNAYYLSIGLLLWIAMVESGIHGTLCGAILAMVIPVTDKDEPNPSFSNLEHVLRPIVYYFILPLFAFINSGVTINTFSLDHLNNPMALGIIFGLFIGKQLGIFIFSYAAVKLNLCSLPSNVSWRKFYAIGALGGIGFTLSLFIGDLTFEASGPNYIMRISVIIGSLLSALFGTAILLALKRKSNNEDQ